MSHSNPQGIKPGDIVILQRLINPVSNQELRPINLMAYKKLEYLETVGTTYEVAKVHNGIVELLNNRYALASCHLAHCQLSRKAEERPEFWFTRNDGTCYVKRFIYEDGECETRTVASILSSCPTSILKEIVAYREENEL